MKDNVIMLANYDFSFGLRELKKEIENGKKILIFNISDVDLLKSIDDAIKGNKIINLVVWQSTEESFRNGYVKYITNEMINEALSMYRMYDFSDKVFVISDSDRYGSLLNYDVSGILTKNEIAYALIADI